jgi:hypothetical protein
MSPPDDFATLDASLATDVRFEEGLRRVSYQPGMLLGLEATRAEQGYHRRRHTRHAYWLHGSGTVVGLRVAATGDDPGDDTTRTNVRLLVSPGVGVDGLGREVSVSEPYCLDLGAWVDALKPGPPASEAWSAALREGYEEATNVLGLEVTFRYQDAPSGVQPVIAMEVNAGTDPVAPSLVKDCVLLELRAARPVAADREHPFAAHEGLRPYAEIAPKLADADRKQVEAATGAARAQLELAARLLHALGEDSAAILSRESATTLASDLARTLLARVSLRLGDGRKPVVNPRRVAVDNLARPFLFNASTLARLLRE